MGRLLVALITMAMAAVPQTPTWRSAPTPALMLPSSTDCWEPAIAVGPREQVYIVAGQRSGPPGSKEFDQRQVLWRSLDGGTTFEGPWPLSIEGHRQADQRIAVDRAGTIYASYMDYENLNPGAPIRLRRDISRDPPGRVPSVCVIHALIEGLVLQRILTPELFPDDVFFAAFEALAHHRRDPNLDATPVAEKPGDGKGPASS